jgi:hypothetical protein
MEEWEQEMKLIVELVLILSVVAWAVSKFYLQIDYGLAKAVALLALACYAIVLPAHLAKIGKSPE